MASAGQKKRAKKRRPRKGWAARVRVYDAAEAKRERRHAERMKTFTDVKLDAAGAAGGEVEKPARVRREPFDLVVVEVEMDRVKIVGVLPAQGWRL